MSKSELLTIMEQLERDKGVKKQELLALLESALVSAYKKLHGKEINVEAKIDPETGSMQAELIKQVVENVVSPATEISEKDAKKINPVAIIGETVRIALDVDEFSRIAAQTARQIIIQKIKEKEKEALIADYSKKVGELLGGNVFRIIGRTLIVDLGKGEGIIPSDEQIPGERLSIGRHIKALLLKIDDGPKGHQIILSRKNPAFVKKLFESEIPEIYEKVVEILKVERDAGLRTKMVVVSNNQRVDPVGACIGIKGSRIKPIIDELNGEKIDLIHNTSDISKLIEEAMSPAKNVRVHIISALQKTAEVVVPDAFTSQAVGKYGHNIRLAGRLTGWNISVISESAKKEQSAKETKDIKDEISKLKGIGEKTAAVLKKAGFDGINKLALAKTEELVAIQGIGEKTAEKIIAAAKKSTTLKNGE